MLVRAVVMAGPAATPLDSWQPEVWHTGPSYTTHTGGVVPARPGAAVQPGWASPAWERLFRPISPVSVRRPAGARDESRVPRLGETAATATGLWLAAAMTFPGVTSCLVNP